MMIPSGGELRSSHFQLGSTNQPNQFVSTMKMNYNQGESGPPAQIKDKLNLRASHFELGDHKSNYQTSFKNHYPVHTNVENAKLNDEKKHDLRTNHFVLGHQDGNRQSVTKQTFTEKPISQNVHFEQEAQKVKMRAHHHNFAETDVKQMRTYYNQQYQGYPAEARSQTKEQLQDRVIQLRQSHIILGKEKVPMQSIQQKEFNPKEAVIQEVKKVAPQQSHFILGRDNVDFKTSNQEFHPPQKIDVIKMSEETQQNLRATHFTLGQDGQAYKTEAMANFVPTANNVLYHHNAKAIQQNNFDLGINKNNNYTTHYQATMKPPQVQPNSAQGGRNDRADRGSNFVVGTMPIPYTSEFSDHFTKGPSQKPASLDPRLMKDLRGSHFRFNDVASNQFKTTSGQTYGRQLGQPNMLDPSKEANLRSHHFKLGQADNDYLSTTHRVHQPLDGKPAQLNPKQAQEIKTHHFSLS